MPSQHFIEIAVCSQCIVRTRTNLQPSHCFVMSHCIEVLYMIHSVAEQLSTANYVKNCDIKLG